jgi:hypothetical protein
MSKEKTIITEIATAIGASGSLDLAGTFTSDSPPKVFEGIDVEVWSEIRDLYFSQSFSTLFQESFDSGRYFFEADQGLRFRSPLSVEWKGPHKPPELDPLPADIRIDHVFIVSCKNVSKILRNASPASVFDEALNSQKKSPKDWYLETAHEQYCQLLSEVVSLYGLSGFPVSPDELSPNQRDQLKSVLKSGWPKSLEKTVKAFIHEVGHQSASRLHKKLATKREQEQFYWRVIRCQSSPYFILGNQPSGPMRLRVLTPWDIQRLYEFQSFELEPGQTGQPEVEWKAHHVDRETQEIRTTQGHIEIRWSHGKFCGSPEAKIYLDTPHANSTGYIPI